MNYTLIESEFKKEYYFTNDNGDTIITTYQIYPKVKVSYISVHMDVFDFSYEDDTNSIRLSWCKEGRIEQEVEDEFYYLMPGDLSFELHERKTKKYSFPTNHYHGISIEIDIDNKIEYISELAKLLDIDYNIIKNLCGTKNIRILRSYDDINKILLDIYSIPEEQRLDYLKIKLHELFYKFKYIETSHNEYITVSKALVAFVKAVSKYIKNNINNKITLKDIAVEFSVSDTYIQNAFNQVYGMPVITFIRIQKMQEAALQLIKTDKTISEISLEFGYSNESKFSQAFKKIMGDTPSTYRKEHSKIKIL